MQLVFTVEEFRALIHFVRDIQNDPELDAPLKRSAPVLLEKLYMHDMGFGIDELEDLEAILKVVNGKLCRDLAAPHDDVTDEELRHREDMLERIMDRVTETCAMG